MLRSIGAVMLLVLAVQPVQAEGRFTLTLSGEGYVKLDTQTGAVSHCQKRETGFACVLVPDDRDALQAEIDRLSARIKTLENAGTADALANRLPSDKDMDRALEFMDRALRRFRDTLKGDDTHL